MEWTHLITNYNYGLEKWEWVAVNKTVGLDRERNTLLIIILHWVAYMIEAST